MIPRVRWLTPTTSISRVCYMNKKNRPIKLEDLAKKLKVSKVTISKALRDHPDISAATTTKVKELAEKLGYMPNIMAKNLSSRKSNTIGVDRSEEHTSE